MTVADLLRRTTASEITEWAEFYKIQPFGEDRADARAVAIASASLAPWRKKGSKPLSAADLGLKSGTVAKDRGTFTVQEGIEHLAQVTRAMGGKDLRHLRK
jgi:hypothetical protein